MLSKNLTQQSSFQHFVLDRPANYFDQLEKSVNFETVYPGRFVAILVDKPAAGPPLAVDTASTTLVPIVRTTTVYTQPPQWFKDVHKELAKDVLADTPYPFNNAMLELYTGHYRKMRYHSDQALDLVPGSSIVIFSCYDSPQATRRKLMIKDKLTKKVTQEIILENNMVVRFSLEANRAHLHKIVPAVDHGDVTGRWIGVTLRTSKTFVAHPLGTGGMHLASEEERGESLHLRSLENKLVEYCYPPVPYTTSPSDLMLPV